MKLPVRLPDLCPLPYGAVDKVLNPVAQDAGLQYRGRPVRMESGIGSFDPL